MNMYVKTADLEKFPGGGVWKGYQTSLRASPQLRGEEEPQRRKSRGASDTLESHEFQEAGSNTGLLLPSGLLLHVQKHTSIDVSFSIPETPS